MKYVQVEVRPPRATWRIVVTVLLLLGSAVTNVVVHEFVREVTSAVASKQVDGDANAYRIVRAASRVDIAFYASTATVVLLAAVWIVYAYKLLAWHALATDSQQQGKKCEPADRL